MKTLLIVLLCALSVSANAQQKSFKINGKVKGTDTLRYVYAFDNETKLLERAEIIDQKFLLQGTYNLNQRFGDLPSAAIVFSNSKDVDAVKADRPHSRRAHHRAHVILEEEIDLIYDIDKREFTINGGALNKIQNKFEFIFSSYRNRRDSAYASLDKINPDDKDGKVSEANRLFKAAVDQMIELVGQNPDSEASLRNFSAIIYDQLTPAAQAENAFNQLSDRIKNSEYGVHVKVDLDDKIEKEVQLEKPPYTVGMKFPYFELPDMQGRTVKSNATFGKYTLIDFWATWCGPCRQETPNLILAENKFGAKGFKVVTISIDQVSAHKKWLEVLESDKMASFINLFNGNDLAGLARELKVVAIPANFLLDSTGKIVATNLRGEELQHKLKELIP